MPIFGLVWVASWVNCFFSSSQDLLRAPSYLANALPIQTAFRVSGSQGDTLPAAHDRSAMASPKSSRSLKQPAPKLQVAPMLSFLLPDVAATHPSSGLLGAFKGLFSGFQKLTVVPNPPPVVVSSVEPTQAAKASLVAVDTAGMGFGQCFPIAPLNHPASGSASGKPVPSRSLFQVKVKQYVVGAASKRREAVQIAHRLEQVLKAAKPRLDQLQPGIVQGRPGGKWGDRVLFSIDKQLADQWDCTPEMLAIQWINDLRVAVAQPPLAIADAQVKMHGLRSTGQSIEGLASWYGPYFHGRQTATGETFNQNDLTAAHPTLPFDTYLKVTNVTNGTSVIVRVNDRGPYFENRTLDLSREAARCLGSETAGVVAVEAEIMEPIKPTVAANRTIAQRL